MTISHPTRLARALVAVALALCCGGAVPMARQEPGAIPFPVAQIFFELNHSAGDLGIHGEVDGGPWTALEVEGPGERLLLSLVSRGRLRAQGMTQLAFESAEPTFAELDPADFFRRFPEGLYEIEGRARDGGTLESTVRLSHVLAAPAGSITVNGLAAAENCEAPVLPEVESPVRIDWEPVTRSHPEIGKRGPVSISRYQFFVELLGGKLSVDLAPTTTEHEVSLGAADRGRAVKFEIIARTETGNNTAVESCFRLR
jgi:hypothetical protein